MREVVDRRDIPSETNCTLALTGEEDEAVRAPTDHAPSVAAHENTADLRTQMRSNLRDEMPRPA